MRVFLSLRSRLFVLALASSVASGPALGASHDPTRTVTIYLHGFEREGVERHGVFGEDVDEPLADSVATMAGLPLSEPNAQVAPNEVVGTTYYGDVAPSYYTAADRDELDAVTAQWGGGVPRYALIVAKYVRRVLARSGAQQANIVSASFGSLVARWMIEKNLEGLAAEGRIARWLTLEGVIGGNWAASHPEVIDVLALVGPEPIDVLHMQYGWIEANLHAPRADSDNPLLSNLLIGQVASTDDRGNGGLLRDAMLVLGEYGPNDGVQAATDARFRSLGAAAQFLGRGPTSATFHADHLGLAHRRAAWAEAAIFLTANRRVTVTLKSARVANLHEASMPWWDWRPAEVLFEARVFSPAAQARWGITDPVSALVKDGAAAPLVRYQQAGETRQISQVVFDDLVAPEETSLRLDLHAWEVDYDPRYGVVETIQTPYHDDLGGGVLSVSTLAPGLHSFASSDWSCEVEVQVLDYPFQSLVGVATPRGSSRVGSLAVSPQPAVSRARIAAAGSPAPHRAARLEILDVTGRVLRVLEGRADEAFVWDARDSRGTPVRAGIYLARLRWEGGERRGRICLTP